MAPDADLSTQLTQLQQQHRQLQADYRALQEEMKKQEISASQWLAQRTREMQAEALEQKKAETLQRVFYRIAERAAADLSFYEFLQAVHGLLGELVYARNCYVCLYDADKGLKHFPYYVDERDGDTLQRNDVPVARGITEFVINSARPQIIDADRLRELNASGEVTQGRGDMSFSSWLGAPLHIRGAVGGIIAVQGYEPGVAYTASDADILSFVANHVSSAIERYLALDELRKSEERYRTVIENVGVGVVVVQNERMVFVNPSLVRIVGHPREYLLSQPFTASLHPDDIPGMKLRHERRLRGESVESMYSFRVITQHGEVRSLELSAVKIEWGKNEATLIFVVDATARLEAEKTRRLTLQRQTELNDMKARFISVASHEFRTPLAFILSSAELLKYYGERLPPAERADVINTIETGVQRMTGMLDRVLQLGKVEAQMLEFRPADIDLKAVCTSLIEDARIQHAGGGCELALEFGDVPVRGMFDEKLLRHIFGNLLSNAIKYSPQGGRVRFSISPAQGRVLFEVSDEGIGIPAEEIPHLFEWFHRASNVGDVQGTGLGLAIVKNSADLHGATLEVHSTIGEGSRFSVLI